MKQGQAIREVTMEYSEKVLDHFMHPRNMGEISDATASGTVGNPICGDIMKMDLKIENNIIIDAKFKVEVLLTITLRM